MATQICYAAEDAAPADESKMSAECIRLRNDMDADLAEVLKAGCQPSLAQMSKLMDNPLVNVAMLFTQFDVYKMTDDEFTDKDAVKSVYTGIAQFPKALNDDWNLINRVVWTVPSMPLDQEKIDDAGGGKFGSAQGTILPPTGSDTLPVDVFDGRTSGFSDMYYVALFSPTEGIKMSNGNFLWGAGFDLGAPTAN